MTDEILALNSGNELVAKDPSTGNVRPIQVSDLSASSRLNLDDGALLTLGSNDDFGLRYDATADSFVVADNTNGTDTVTVDRTTGDIDTVGNVSATNVSADTQMNSSSTRPNIFADDVDVNSITGVRTGGIVLESTDSVDVFTIDRDTTDEIFVTLYDGSARNCLGGGVMQNDFDWTYTFSDGNTVSIHGSGYQQDSPRAKTEGGDQFAVGFLPPAENVTKIEVAGNQFASSSLGAYVYML
jgi:hypothetical protein